MTDPKTKPKSTWKAYEEAVAPAWKVYKEARAQAEKVYKEAKRGR